MKLQQVFHLRHVHGSLPLRGAWIEIQDQLNQVQKQASLPLRGAWIEIVDQPLSSEPCEKSLPLRGAWIEILSHERRLCTWHCRSPYGERGLKYHPPSAQPRVRTVAPLTGSVD